MDHVELLNVEELVEITGRGVVVIPDFPVPNGWKDRTEVVVVTKPDGEQFSTNVQFSVTHFNIADSSVSADKRWRITVMLLDRKKVEVPVGSKILVSPEIREAIHPH